jgi:hypothetical protein
MPHRSRQSGPGHGTAGHGHGTWWRGHEAKEGFTVKIEGIDSSIERIQSGLRECTVRRMYREDGGRHTVNRQRIGRR